MVKLDQLSDRTGKILAVQAKMESETAGGRFRAL
jgi:hypothetical protein